jgi:Domain of unknown function (DUF1836).
MKESKSILKNINDIAKEISESTLVAYEDLPEYDLFLSQVIDYLNNRFEEEKYTSNIIQNYIKKWSYFKAGRWKKERVY